VDYLAVNSVGNPVLVFGDTNSRFTRALDNIPSVLKQAGLADAWVQLARGGFAPAADAADIVCTDTVPRDTSCEVVDKVLSVSASASLRERRCSWPPAQLPRLEGDHAHADVVQLRHGALPLEQWDDADGPQPGPGRVQLGVRRRLPPERPLRRPARVCALSASHQTPA
jgi:hypothetical protein